MPAQITDCDHICTLCGQHLAGCDLCGTATIVRLPASDRHSDEFELVQQERAIRRAADSRQGFAPADRNRQMLMRSPAPTPLRSDS